MNKTNKLRAGICISGRGTNALSLLLASRAPDYPMEFVTVVADRPCPGLQLTAQQGVDSQLMDFKSMGRKAFEAALQYHMSSLKVELLLLAGFMRIFSKQFIALHRGRILNIHPSLLPSFKGLNTHAKVIESKMRTHGCTVHVVNEELDSGTILAQRKLLVYSDDTESTLAGRVLELENQLYPECAAEYANKLLQVRSANAQNN